LEPIGVKEQVKKLLEKSDRNFEAANKLLEDGYYESSVSRAYYSIFYLAEASLLTIDLSFSKHSAVISAFGKHFAANEIINPKCHRILIDANLQRKTGDYDFMASVSEEEAESLLNAVEEFRLNVKRYLNKWIEG
jgi:uncharacterized protein (UPF0332 family)